MLRKRREDASAALLEAEEERAAAAKSVAGSQRHQHLDSEEVLSAESALASNTGGSSQPNDAVRLYMHPSVYVWVTRSLVSVPVCIAV